MREQRRYKSKATNRPAQTKNSQKETGAGGSKSESICWVRFNEALAEFAEQLFPFLQPTRRWELLLFFLLVFFLHSTKTENESQWTQFSYTVLTGVQNTILFSILTDRHATLFLWRLNDCVWQWRGYILHIYRSILLIHWIIFVLF